MMTKSKLETVREAISILTEQLVPETDSTVQQLNESISRGTLNPELNTASKCLLLAAVNIYGDATRSFEHYLQADDTESPEMLQYDLDCTAAGLDQAQRVLNVLLELEGLKDA